MKHPLLVFFLLFVFVVIGGYLLKTQAFASFKKKKFVEYDQCVLPSPTLSPLPSVSPSPSVSPEPSPSLEVSPSPQISPTPSVECGDACRSWTPPESIPTPPQCTDTVPGKVGGIYVDQGVVNDGKLEVRWWPPEGASQVHIIYTDGNPGEWRYALLNTENDGSQVIGDLKKNTHYWFAVAGVNGCAVGEFSSAFDPIP